MPNSIRSRVTVISTIITTTLVACVAALIFYTAPAAAAPHAQANIPNFVLNSQTMISVTVAITDGQVIVIPLDLTFVVQNSAGQADVSIIADVEQQPGLFIGVSPAEEIATTLQLSQTASAPATSDTTGATAGSTPSPAIANTDSAGTYVVNNNANLRAGPGTDFDIVGSVDEGDTVVVVGENEDGSWYQLDDDNWIAAFLVDPATTEDEAASEEASDAATESEPESEPVGESTTAESSTDEDETADASTATATPSPTRTVPAGISNAFADQAALTAYLLEVAEIGAGVSGAVDELTDLMQNPQPLNPQWRNDVSAQLAVMSNALDQYLALTPVPGYEDLHTQITNVALTCEQAVDYLVTGMENPRSIDPTVATQSIQACASQATDLAAYLETLQ